ncbi:MAG TPA: Wzz/FepE/Etk N-terminal domain-containing protein, partial [Anaerolineaceae bacterium]|nr:Wzz/FepE/Etk N-terminal domain-containing protein [Anaerolineaceae bacterium]
MDPELDSNKTIDDLVEFGRTLLKWSWLLVLVAVIFGGAVYYYTNQLPRVYQASTKLVVNITSDASGVDVSTQALNLAGKYARTMITKDLLSKTATQLGTPISKA